MGNHGMIIVRRNASASCLLGCNTPYYGLAYYKRPAESLRMKELGGNSPFFMAWKRHAKCGNVALIAQGVTQGGVLGGMSKAYLNTALCASSTRVSESLQFVVRSVQPVVPLCHHYNFPGSCIFESFSCVLPVVSSLETFCFVFVDLQYLCHKLTK